MTIDALQIILTGALVAGSCALVGSFMVLRKMAMLGDAISHAVLPGIIIAFLLSNSRGSLTMFIGAVVFGLITTLLVQFLSNRGVQGDASIGVAFTFLFAVGVVLVSLFGQSVDLDLDCVLHGEIAYTPFDTLVMNDQNFGPRPLWINGALFGINILLVLLFYKQFKICAFDPAMAAAVGINVVGMHYLLMMMVSVTTVGAFESVGAILVVAMLIVPGATAYLLTERLNRMLIIAVLLGVASSLIGYFVASAIDASIAGSMATVSGLFFLAAFFFSPSSGLVSKMIAQWQLRTKIVEEDALLWAWRYGEAEGSVAFNLNQLASGQGWKLSKAKTGLSRLLRSGFLARTKGAFTLSTSGKEHALNLIRRHRLYESYLDEYGNYATDHLHDPTDRVEHYITNGIARRMNRAVSEKTVDPHGKPIPHKNEKA